MSISPSKKLFKDELVRSRMKSLFSLCLCFLILTLGAEENYDPEVFQGEVDVHLTSMKYGERSVPLKIYLPENQKVVPVILLSHGLGGSREVGAYVGEHWAGRGYVVVAMQHIGSDESVWKGVPRREILGQMTAAANPKTFGDRMRDVPKVLDQLEKWNVEKDHVLKGRMDLKKIGIGGHSYGAITAQAIGGQAYGLRGQKYFDDRIDAVLAMSPSPPRVGNVEKAFGAFKLPALLMTGTKDHSMIGKGTPEDRLKVFRAMPDGGKYELVLKDAEHFAFSDHRRDGKAHRNPNHHVVIKSLSTAFWDAYLKEEAALLKWINGGAPKALLEEGDTWKRK